MNENLLTKELLFFTAELLIKFYQKNSKISRYLLIYYYNEKH